jgi:3-oxosteroid 1-dehydrogenase
MYQHHREVDCIPSWFIMDAQHRARYSWGTHLPLHTPKEWLDTGYFIKADSLEELARLIGLDPRQLGSTVDRFNYFAARGKDEDFGKGERAYDRWYGDPRVRPNPCLGTVEKAPFYAVKVYPGDVGTAGGLVTDERGRVLTSAHTAIRGLYACGTSSASVMGHTYPGPGATIAPAMVFGRIAALDALEFEDLAPSTRSQAAGASR